MLTTHKHCTETKAQADNAEHINCFGILYIIIYFLWKKISDKTNNDVWEALLAGEQGEYAVSKLGILFIMKRKQSDLK